MNLTSITFTVGLTALSFAPIGQLTSAFAQSQFSVSPRIGILRLQTDVDHLRLPIGYFPDEQDLSTGIAIGLQFPNKAIQLSYDYAKLDLGSRLFFLEPPGEPSQQLFTVSHMDLHLLRIMYEHGVVRRESGKELRFSAGVGMVAFNPGRNQFTLDHLAAENRPAVSEVPREYETVYDPVLSLGGSVIFPLGSRPLRIRLNLHDNVQFCNNRDDDGLHYLCSTNGLLHHLETSGGIEFMF